jgi:prevent-host-death family protein
MPRISIQPWRTYCTFCTVWVMDKTMSLVEARDSLGQRVDAAHYADEATVITKNGHPRAVIVSYEWYRELADKLVVNHDDKVTKG